MSKRKFELVSASESFRTDSNLVMKKTNWNLCLVCQSDSNEKLVCPSNSKRTDKFAGFKTLLEGIRDFEKVKELPYDLSSGRLCEGEKSELETLIEKNAKYHKSCKNKFDSHHLDRVQFTSEEVG